MDWNLIASTAIPVVAGIGIIVTLWMQGARERAKIREALIRLEVEFAEHRRRTDARLRIIEEKIDHAKPSRASL